MLTIEDFRNQNKDLTPYTDGQIDYLRMVYDVIQFPWKCFKDDNVEVQKHQGAFGDVFVLLIDGQCYMTTSPHDLLDHACLITEASGSVLLTGLGLGLGILLCDANSVVSSITVVENNPLVIKYIAPVIYQNTTRITPTVIAADANTWVPNQYFDFAYIDHHACDRMDSERYHQYCSRVVNWHDERTKLEATWR